MSRHDGSDVQRAIDFLLGEDLVELDHAALPARPDYESLAQHAAALGHELSPEGLRRAFQLIMRARLLASPAPSDERP